MKQVAKKTVVNGIKFDSQMEAEFYGLLMLRERIGELKLLRCHPKYILQPKFTKHGVVYQPITYSADFEIRYPDGRIEIIDVKGYETEKFQLKRKIFEYQFPDLSLVLMKKDDQCGWITGDEYSALRKEEKKRERKLSSRAKPTSRNTTHSSIKKPPH